ncbi:hypothetical protein C8P63_10935 [Melghirimyces profundicolus]|uniref:Uncharacterized protein n=1 Tax=Melghirimyces profundicolus TaxID=1242148 RepID=A0A2T6BW28_9BACL|nr:hypothetical protein C8P63_10935 [Melghirimyces profundicolus]
MEIERRGCRIFGLIVLTLWGWAGVWAVWIRIRRWG